MSAKRSSGKLKTGLLLLGWLAVAGCTTVNRMQCQILPAEKEGTVISEADRQAVQEMLQVTAKRLRLVDRTDISLVPQTIVFYTEIDVENPYKLIAWEHNGSIMVDFLQGAEGVGESLQFRDARVQLYDRLQERFPGRVKMVPISKYQGARERSGP